MGQIERGTWEGSKVAVEDLFGGDSNHLVLTGSSVLVVLIDGVAVLAPRVEGISENKVLSSLGHLSIITLNGVIDELIEALRESLEEDLT